MITGTIIGRLGSDPSVKYTENGLVIAEFSVASNRIKKDAETTWVKCTAFGKTAEVVGDYLTKGKKVALSGEMYLESWEDKEGNKKQNIKMTVATLELIESKVADIGNGASITSRISDVNGVTEEELPPF